MTQPSNSDESIPDLLDGALQRDPVPLSSSASASIDTSVTHQTTSSETSIRNQNLLIPPSTPESKSASLSRSHSQSSYADGRTSPIKNTGDQSESYRQLVFRSFAPRVAVFASPDTEEFAQGKGFQGGLCSLLRSFGEEIPGKVIIRDSIGGSKAWDGFGVRFVRSDVLQPTTAAASGSWDFQARSSSSQYLPNQRTNPDPSLAIESSLKRYLPHNETSQESRPRETGDAAEGISEADQSSFYRIYLRQILSSSPLVPYESFSHPVTCLITVSSHNPAPIDTLRQLYNQTSAGANRIPAWMGAEYLRYYVLVHDEEQSDIVKSTALFDLMKRHFGLNCHLLRLRSTRFNREDEEVSRLPPITWLTAEEHLASGHLKDYMDDSYPTDQYLADSEVVAIRSFLREMVVQSIIPFMENRVVTWNDQVASRRRGISGRFMSLSKRFAGFGTTKSGSSSPGNGPNSGSNYNAHDGFYPANTPEATMRQLADYAFMLRDWKLAYTTYDLLRTDFGHDKAWYYHAAANEMAAITSLLYSQTPGSRYRADLVDQLLENATYSYLTRCSSPWGVIRCLTVALELLKDHGPPCADDVRKWGSKLLESDVLRSVGQALTCERIASSYDSRSALGPLSRERQAALWHLLSSNSWSKLDKIDQAQSQLRDAAARYTNEKDPNSAVPFPSMQVLWNQISKAAKAAGALDASTVLVDTTVEQAVSGHSKRHHQRSSTLTQTISVGDVDDEGFTAHGAGDLSYDQ